MAYYAWHLVPMLCLYSVGRQPKRQTCHTAKFTDRLVLTGLGHGASWNFIVWGLYFGILIIMERLFLGKLLGKAARFSQHRLLLFTGGYRMGHL